MFISILHRHNDPFSVTINQTSVFNRINNMKKDVKQTLIFLKTNSKTSFD